MRLLERLPYGFNSAVRLTREVPLHAMVRTAGRSRETGPEYSWDGMRRGIRPFAVLQVTISGQGLLRQPGGEFRIPAGTALLAQIPSEHVYSVDPDAAWWDFAYAVFHGRELLRLLQHVGGDSRVIAWTPDGCAEQQFFDLLTAVRRQDRASVYELSARAYAVAMSLLDPYDAPKDGAPKHGGTDRGIELARAHLRRNLAEPITVEDLARVAGYSRHHFSRRFKEKTGLPPVRYLQEARCEAAARLLTTGALSIKEIATRCGFDSSSYFCRVFQRATGVSPSEYRRSRP